ncbi:cytochrome P450 [Streptomyces abikoensis]|uniref:cytochrome P450 n=1 Tax=Streptomyces abikoensis TaxID=97398 RepID=UPI0033D792F5
MTRVPLLFGTSVWLVSGPAEVREVLSAKEAFSNDLTRLRHISPALPDQALGGLGMCDPPLHTRMRQMLAPEFTARGLRRLEPAIRDIVAEQLDLMAAAPQPVDLVRTFAWPVPARTICELLGVPAADLDTFRRLSTRRFDIVAGLGAQLGAVSSAQLRLERLIADERRKPGSGLLGTLVTRGADLDDRTLAGLADGVLTGGLETSAGMITLGTLLLLRDPTARERATDGRTVGALTEELLRDLSVVQVAFPRYALTDVEIGNHQVSKGDVVLCSLLRANRRTDAEAGAAGTGTGTGTDAPRGDRRHMAFGHGAHRCLGAELARMELRIAYQALFERYPRMRLAIDERELPFHGLAMVYGLQRLPVDLGLCDS